MIRLEPEYRFHPNRRWRFDWANCEHMIAIEIEGGIYTNGRHTRGKGFANDMEKYNEATAMGWHIFRVTPKEFREFKHFDLIAKYMLNKSLNYPAF